GSLAEHVVGAIDLAPGAFRSFSATELGFALSSDMRIFLYAPTGDPVLDGAELSDGSVARLPDGRGPFLFPDEPTPGAANKVTLRDEIVINEIHYHPFPEPAREPEWDESLLVAVDGEWRYDDTGQNLGTSWRSASYDDSSWARGDALFYVENAPLPAPKQTEITIGPTTFYFRTEFELDDDPAEVLLRLSPIVDDGLVAYLNGQEILRLHMPDGPIDATTLASRSVGDASFFGPFDIESAPLVRGRNVLAVEVHQSTEASTDVAFGMEVIAARFVHEGNPYRESREE